MVLKIVDVASYQGTYKFGSNGEDGLIVKATQGTNYVNPYCDGVAQQMIKNGRPWGIYHYAGGGNFQAEAKHFINSIKGYLNVTNKPILILDWEKGSNQSWGNGKWASDFINEVKSLTKVQAGIYTGSDGVAQTGNYLAKSAFLWFAGYPTNANVGWSPVAFPYNSGAWAMATGWQFSSNPLDKSLFYIDVKGWKKLAGNTSTSNPSTPSTPAYSTNGKTLEQMATDVINKKAGSGSTRTKLLGKYNNGVQAIVNQRLKAINATQATNILVSETKKNIYGTGDKRKKMLGSYYGSVQNVINKSSAVYYAVRTGDNLSSIAAKYKTTVAKIVSLNGLKDANLIYAGQKLRVK